MARFYVGQRVRVRHDVGAPRCAGREATIIGPLSLGRGGDGNGYWGYPVDVDGVGRLTTLGVQMIALDWQIEPITDSNSVIAWSECAWKPEHLRSEVSA